MPFANLSLGPELDAWNQLAHDDEARVRYGVERRCRKFMCRRLLPRLTGSQIRIMLFIADRTLSWGWYAEVIPYSHFIRGVRDQQGDLIIDGEGNPLNGCGISKEETLRIGIQQLIDGGAIERFPVRVSGRTTYAYMPASRRNLAKWIIDCEGSLPIEYRVPFALELVAHHGQVVQVDGIRDDTAQVTEIGSYRNRMDTNYEAPINELSKIDPTHLRAMRVERYSEESRSAAVGADVPSTRRLLN